jgi:molybdopterin synthase sulfur carrier subunit
MNFKIKLFGNFRYIANSKEIDIEVAGDTVRDIIKALEKDHSDLVKAAMNGDELNAHVTFNVNGRNIRDMDYLSTKVSQDDKISLFPPMAGG